MKINEKEASIFRELLSHHGINTYVVEAIPEGYDLPGGSYPGEIHSMSGIIITPTSAYDFWLDWENGAYTLGEEDGYWEELSEADLGSDLNSVRKIQAQFHENAS